MLAGMAAAVVAFTLMIPAGGGRVRAAGIIDFAKDASLTVHHYEPGDEKIPVEGVHSYIWRIADVDEDAVYTLLYDIAGIDKMALNDFRTQKDWDDFQEQMYPYLISYQVRPDANGISNAIGETYYGSTEAGRGLTKGIYFVHSDDLKKDNTTWSFIDFFVAVPGRTEDVAVGDPYDVYEVDAAPKRSKEEGGEEDDEYEIHKRWEDSGYEASRPRTISVSIYDKNWIFQEKVTLSSDNYWTYKWRGPKDQTYYIVEDTVENYTVTYTRNGASISMVNTRGGTTPPPPPDNPPPPPDTPPDNPPDTPPDNPPTDTPPTDTPPTETPPTDNSTPLGTLRNLLNDVPNVLGAIRNPQATETPSVLGARRLPQTGQLWWPVPILIILGLILIVRGLSLERRRRMEAAEAAA